MANYRQMGLKNKPYSRFADDKLDHRPTGPQFEFRVASQDDGHRSPFTCRPIQVGRRDDEIEKTNLTPLLLARTEAELKAKRERLGVPADYRGYAVTTDRFADV